MARRFGRTASGSAWSSASQREGFGVLRPTNRRGEAKSPPRAGAGRRKGRRVMLPVDAVTRCASGSNSTFEAFQVSVAAGRLIPYPRPRADRSLHTMWNHCVTAGTARCTMVSLAFRALHFRPYFYSPRGGASRQPLCGADCPSPLRILLAAYGDVDYLGNDEIPAGIEANLFVGHFWAFDRVWRPNSFPKKCRLLRRFRP